MLEDRFVRKSEVVWPLILRHFGFVCFTDFILCMLYYLHVLCALVVEMLFFLKKNIVSNPFFCCHLRFPGIVLSYATHVLARE